MCGRFSFHTYQKLKNILYFIEEEPPENLSNNISPFKNIGALYNNSNNKPAFKNMYWQLIPEFSPEFKSTYSMYNTRAETLFHKKFKKTLILNKRCLIPVNSYYEWENSQENKIPYQFYIENKEIFFLGGIYSIWQDSLNLTKRYTCSIITTEAAPPIKQIHPRMPLIINKNIINEWLDRNCNKPQEISQMITSYLKNDLTYKQFNNNTLL